MNRNFATATAVVTALLLTACAGTKAQKNAQQGEDAMQHNTPNRTGYIDANGLRYYYEVHGQGAPLLLLHGGLGSIDMFGPVLQRLAKTREVIAVDLHGHGRTALGNRDINLEDIGRDLAVVLEGLGYAQVDAVGYSFGGGAAFQLAVQRPQMVRRLVLISAGYSMDGYYDEIRAQQAQVSAAAASFMKETPMYQGYVAVAPHPEDFPKLLDQMGAYMRKGGDWSEEVKTLAMPTMIVFGDSDMYKPEHIVRFYQLLGGGLRDAGWNREQMSQHRLAILPGATHYDILFSPLLVDTVLPFVDEGAGAARSAGN